MSLQLRPYQIDLHAEAKAAIAQGHRSVCIQSPTGSGKTCLVAHMLKNCVSRGYSAFFLVHRRELVLQSISTLTHAADLSVGIVAAGFSPTYSEKVQVCMVGSLPKRMKFLRKPDLIVVDEAHHLLAKSWRSAIEPFPDAVKILLTATPERLDGAGLGEVCTHLIQGPSVSDLISQGWLSPYKLYSPGNPNLSGVHTRAGEYDKKEVAAVMNASSVMGDALTYYKKFAMGTRAVVFAWSVESSKQVAQEFNAAGIPAAHLDGITDDTVRETVVRSFRDGSIKVLCNVDIVSEGFDLPSAEACFDLAPTKSVARYLQRVGRVMRPSPGKIAQIFDHAGNAFRKDANGEWQRNHGYPDEDRIWSLEGRSKRKSNNECPVRQCPKCYATVPAASMTCRYCGFQWQVQGREIDQAAGELAEVDVETARATRKAEEKSATDYDALVALGRSRNYRDPEGWARHKLNARRSSYWAHRNAAKLRKASALSTAANAYRPDGARTAEQQVIEEFL